MVSVKVKVKELEKLGKGVELKLKLIKGGGSSSKGYCRCSSKRMSKEYFCCSSTCRMNETPICHCGQRSVMRTANTTKNRGKHFWGCSKYKNGVQDAGCNFFKWCTDVGSEDSGRYVKSEGNKETLVSNEEFERAVLLLLCTYKSSNYEDTVTSIFEDFYDSLNSHFDEVDPYNYVTPYAKAGFLSRMWF
ncbi:hypothetical protein V8G54_037467 [Vigna mungo]|uniref:GRF-type domain-containing protein n=1 Tax=Vigna mungo TaxID=3915 RepID=A0AAQ3RE38_VIGMU